MSPLRTLRFQFKYSPVRVPLLVLLTGGSACIQSLTYWEDDGGSMATPTPRVDDSSPGTPTSYPNGDDDSSPATPTPPPESVTVTFTVDTNGMADGINQLAWVDTASGEQVFIVGPFNGWDPQDPGTAMTDNGDGTFSFDIAFPITDVYGTVYNPGDTEPLLYKFAKTTSDAENSWANGVKAYFPTDEAGCPNPTWSNPSGVTDAYTGGLWEITWSLDVIPTEDATIVVIVDAWRDYAEGFGYPSCD